MADKKTNYKKKEDNHSSADNENYVDNEEQPKRSKFLSLVLSFLFTLLVLVVIAMVTIYYLQPFKNEPFFVGENNGNTNFTIGSEGSIQFYENMRFPDKVISYNIENACPLPKKDEMLKAFRFMEEKTILSFYQKDANAQIKIQCENVSVPRSGLFVAGEGGPTNITSTPKYNIINEGQILLLRESRCPKPNVEIHELMHVLGFEHSINPNNIMFNISKCSQEMGQDSIDLINTLYSVESLPDLNILNVSGRIHSRYLDFQIEIQNQGLAPSSNGNINVYGDEKLIKSFELNPIDTGYGKIISIENILLVRNVKEIQFEVEIPDRELDKKNNVKKLSLD